MINGINFSVPVQKNINLKSTPQKAINSINSNATNNTKVSSELLKAYNNVVSFKGNSSRYDEYDLSPQKDEEMLDYIRRQNEIFSDANVDPSVTNERFYSNWQDGRNFSPFPEPNIEPMQEDFVEPENFQMPEDKTSQEMNLFGMHNSQTKPASKDKMDNLIKNLNKICDARPDLDGMLAMLVISSPCSDRILELAQETTDDGKQKYNIDDITTFTGFKSVKELDKYLADKE